MEKMFTLKPGRLPQADVRNIIFFVRPRLELMDIITDNVRRYGRGMPSPCPAPRAAAERPKGRVTNISNTREQKVMNAGFVSSVPSARTVPAGCAAE